MAGARDDFVALVRARAGELWECALLVTGAPEQAREAMRRGVADLADAWGGERAERPDLWVHGAVARAAEALAPEVTTGLFTAPMPADAGDPDAPPPRVRETWSGLGDLTPRQRAVAAMTTYAARSPEDIADALHVRTAVVADEAGAGSRAGLTGPDLADAVDWATARHTAPDETEMAEAAWRSSRERRSRRTVITLGAAGLLAAGAAAAIAVGRSDRPDGRTSPGPSDPAARSAVLDPMPAGGRLASVEVQGLTIDLAPPVDRTRQLPAWQGWDALGLPTPLGFGAGARIPRLDGRTDGAVRAVFLRVVQRAQQWRPVLLLGREGRLVEVDVTLRRVARGASPISTTCIDDDARRVVLPVTGGVVMVDARAGTVTRFEVPDPSIASAGWTAGSRYVVVWGQSAWRLDPTTGQALRAFASDAGHAILVPRSGSNIIIVNGDRGISEQLHAVPRAVTGVGGVSVSDAALQLADAVRFSAAAQEATRGRQAGIFAADIPTKQMRGLAAADEQGTPDLPLRPRGWAGRGVLLLSALAYRGGVLTDRLLAWEPAAGRLWRAGEVTPATTEPGAFSGDYVLAPEV